MAARTIRLTNKAASRVAGTDGSAGSDAGASRITITEDDGDEQSPAFTVTRTVTSADASPDAGSDTSAEGGVQAESDVKSPRSRERDGDPDVRGTDPANIPPRKKRDRHKSDCECERCTARRIRQGKQQPKKATIPTANFEKLLIGLHAGMAAMLKAPEFSIDDDEAKALSEAFFSLSDAYGWNLGMVSPKTEATVNAAIAVSIVYGPKLKTFYNRTKKPHLVPRPQMRPQPTAAKEQTPEPVMVPGAD